MLTAIERQTYDDYLSLLRELSRNMEAFHIRLLSDPDRMDKVLGAARCIAAQALLKEAVGIMERFVDK